MPRKKAITSEDLTAAIAEIKQGATFRVVGDKYGIPRSTLADRLKNYRHAKPGMYRISNYLIQLVIYIFIYYSDVQPIYTKLLF